MQSTKQPDPNTDSGFLSSSNLSGGLDQASETNLSTPDCPDTQDSGLKLETQVHTDSGVDVQLSGPLSDLILDDLNDLDSPTVSQDWKSYFEQDEEKDTQLHLAVLRGDVATVKTILAKAPASKYLDLRNDMRLTALQVAVLRSDVTLVGLLVSAGAKTDSVDHEGNTALHLAVAAGDMPCVRQLLQPEPLPASLRLRYTPPRRPHVLPELNMYNYQGLACVHMALMSNHLQVLKYLVWHGADVDARECKGGLSAVHMAAEGGKAELVKLLVHDLQADPCPLTYSGDSPYRLARHHPALAALLETIGAVTLGDYTDSEDEDHLAAHQEEEEQTMYGWGFRDLEGSSGMVSSPA